MKDYLCIGQVLDLKKYDKTSKLSDFQDRDFYIVSAKAIKENEKEGFFISIEDENGLSHTFRTFSNTVVKQIKDLLISADNVNGVFSKVIKCKLQITPIKIDGKYKERFKLV